MVNWIHLPGSDARIQSLMKQQSLIGGPFVEILGIAAIPPEIDIFGRFRGRDGRNGGERGSLLAEV